jgi:hypothetical protein
MDATTTRLKTKIGDHEFDLEGTPEFVREQFLAWQELVKLAVTAPQKHQPALPDSSAEVQQSTQKADDPNVELDFSKILQTDGRYVSLTVRTASVHDALLVMLYGQKTIRSNDAVTGAELLSGLASTGGYGTPRLDRILDKLAEDGDVMSFGERRGKKYRLTNTGSAKARAIAKDLIATVA